MVIYIFTGLKMHEHFESKRVLFTGIQFVKVSSISHLLTAAFSPAEDSTSLKTRIIQGYYYRPGDLLDTARERYLKNASII